MYIIWDKVFSTLQEVEPGGSWGPTDAIELARARQEVEKDEVDHGGDEYEVSSDEDELELDAGLVEYIDVLELNDNVRDLGETSDDNLDNVDY